MLEIGKRSPRPPCMFPAWRACDSHMGEQPRRCHPREPRGLLGSSHGGGERRGGGGVRLATARVS